MVRSQQRVGSAESDCKNWFLTNYLLLGSVAAPFHIVMDRKFCQREEIRALSMPVIPWEVELARWLDYYIPPIEKRRSYARPSRRQGATPNIPRTRYVKVDVNEDGRTFGVIIDTSGSMSAKMIGMALGSIASYAAEREVSLVRVVFCDARAYDAGYIAPEDIAGRVEVKCRYIVNMHF